MSKGTRIIFLDVDGVLVTIGHLAARLTQEKIVNDICVKNLNRIIDETGAKIAISSAWRFNGLNEMRCILKFWGVKGEVIGATPDLSVLLTNGMYSGVPRINEIENFIEIYGTDNIDSFVILDDLGNKPMSDVHVHTKFQTGLTERDAERAIEILQTNFWKKQRDAFS
jgi:hypothetical protein